MKRKSPQFLYPDHPMYTGVVDAINRNYEVHTAGKTAEEIERLRLNAEVQFQA